MSEELDYVEGVEHVWEDEAKASSSSWTEDLSEKALSYLVQIKDLQTQLRAERMKVERLEMAIRGFKAALEEELKE